MRPRIISRAHFMRIFREYWFYALAFTCAVLWAIFIAPYFVRSTSKMHLGNECYVSGYRDPVTGRTVSSRAAENAADACLAAGSQK